VKAQLIPFYALTICIQRVHIGHGFIQYITGIDRLYSVDIAVLIL